METLYAAAYKVGKAWIMGEWSESEAEAFARALEPEEYVFALNEGIDGITLRPWGENFSLGA